jgi:hypothetical protein
MKHMQLHIKCTSKLRRSSIKHSYLTPELLYQLYNGLGRPAIEFLKPGF